MSWPLRSLTRGHPRHNSAIYKYTIIVDYTTVREGQGQTHAKESMTRIVRQLRSGQVTIPAEFRRELGITEDSLLQMTLDHGELRIRPVEVRDSTKGSFWFKDLCQRFASVREEAGDLTEEDIDQAIDEAVRAVRRGRG
jgi:bifunctional DNA-binding transcriptional regulator/antitoxin component of YhaV-PrlF toxin-antitoxin module